MLEEKHHIPVIDILAYRYYLIFSVRPIMLGVKVVHVGLVPSFRRGFRQGVSNRECFWGSVRVRRWGCRRELSQEQRLLDDFPKGKHLVLMFSLNSGDG